MLHRITELLKAEEDFAFETTLSTKSFVGLINRAKKQNYKVNLLFFYLNSAELAKQRVAKRVNEGGHNIPSEIIERRYYKGIKNLFELYFKKCDVINVFDNSESDSTKLIFTKIIGEELINVDVPKLNELKSKIL